ncbi:MAG: Eco57I restriction-modification methylase domain-containing protein [Adlercreutzia equolifaciens]
MLANCAPLAETYDAVIANPPYMGGKNMNKWLSDWVKKNYPDVKGDLFPASLRAIWVCQRRWSARFHDAICLDVHRNLREASQQDYRRCDHHFLVQLEYSGFAGATCLSAFTLRKVSSRIIAAAMFVSLISWGPQSRRRSLEAIANPDCGWFYRRSADAFKSIPGTP